MIISDRWWSPVIIGDYHWSSVITSNHQWSSVISGDHQWSVVIASDHPWSWVFTSDQWWLPVIISDHQWSVVYKWNPGLTSVALIRNIILCLLSIELLVVQAGGPCWVRANDFSKLQRNIVLCHEKMRQVMSFCVMNVIGTILTCFLENIGAISTCVMNIIWTMSSCTVTNFGEISSCVVKYIGQMLTGHFHSANPSNNIHETGKCYPVSWILLLGLAEWKCPVHKQSWSRLQELSSSSAFQ